MCVVYVRCAVYAIAKRARAHGHRCVFNHMQYVHPHPGHRRRGSCLTMKEQRRNYNKYANVYYYIVLYIRKFARFGRHMTTQSMRSLKLKYQPHSSIDVTQ